MVDIVLGVAVFVLAAAVVGLFAMMGELASRVPEPFRPGPDRELHALATARLGVAPAQWPAELAAVRDADRAHVLVFGSSCITCARIASGQTGPLRTVPEPFAVVVSAPRAEAGADFLAQHPMVRDYPHLVDVGGTWLTGNFAIDMSPSVLVFARGQLQSAYTFTQATELAQLSTLDSGKAAPAHPATAT